MLIKEHFRRNFTKFTNNVKDLNPTSRNLIILGIILAICVVIRWKYIIDEAVRGFKYFSH
ncbi:MAG: hypothetical protein LKI53_09805 [Bacteroidales bacterium]|jgi:ethanolamine transporter EutH|nr:hypothetical protein [Bacteroidales bacterium]